MSWHGETCGNKGGFPVIFSRLRWPIEPNSVHRFVILYVSCDTRSVGLGQYCLPKVSNGFKQTNKLKISQETPPPKQFFFKCNKIKQMHTQIVQKSKSTLLKPSHESFYVCRRQWTRLGWKTVVMFWMRGLVLVILPERIDSTCQLHFFF